MGPNLEVVPWMSTRCVILRISEEFSVKGASRGVCKKFGQSRKRFVELEGESGVCGEVLELLVDADVV